MQEALFEHGYQNARAWANPQREELTDAGLRAGFLDGMIRAVQRDMVDAIGLPFVQAMGGEGEETPAKAGAN